MSLCFCSHQLLAVLFVFWDRISLNQSWSLTLHVAPASPIWWGCEISYIAILHFLQNFNFLKISSYFIVISILQFPNNTQNWSSSNVHLPSVYHPCFSFLNYFCNYIITNFTLCFPLPKPSHRIFLDFFSIHGLFSIICSVYIMWSVCMFPRLTIWYQITNLCALSWGRLLPPLSEFLILLCVIVSSWAFLHILNHDH